MDVVNPQAPTKSARPCSSFDPARVARLAEDAFYVSVGLGIIGFQRLQAMRRERAEQRRTHSTPTDQRRDG